jgi:hypothetical protein
MSDSMKAKYGSVENVTSANFTGEWGAKVGGEGETYTPSGGTIASERVRGTRPMGEDPEEDKADTQLKADITPHFNEPISTPIPETPSISLPRVTIDPDLPSAPTIRGATVRQRQTSQSRYYSEM